MFTLNESSIEWAFKHIKAFYDSDFFPKAFEYEAIDHIFSTVKTKLSKIDLDSYTPKSPRMLLAPKPNDNFRIVHQLDPIDTILYTSLVYEIAIKVEEYRIPKIKEIVFSYRINPTTNGSLFTEGNSWNLFLKKTKELAALSDSKYVIVADIADFYNQVYIHRVNNLISEAGKDELNGHAKVVEKFLKELNKKTSKGIPIGPTASVVISELILADIDRAILKHTEKFCRYVDDYFIFFDTKAKALELLHELTKYLYSPHRLVLSSSKTKVIECSTFLDKIYKDEEYEESLIRKAAIQERAVEILDELVEEEIASFDMYGDTILTPELNEICASVEENEKVKILSHVYNNMLSNLLDTEEKDYSMIRHVIKKATRNRIRSVATLLIDKFEQLMPVAREVIVYLNAIGNDRFLEANIDRIDTMWRGSYINLPYVNTWLSYFWYNKNISRYSSSVNYNSILSLRDRALLAKSKNDTSWIRSYRDGAELLGIWDKRAVLFAACALPRDEAAPWAKSVTASGDLIDHALFCFLTR